MGKGVTLLRVQAFPRFGSHGDIPISVARLKLDDLLPKPRAFHTSLTTDPLKSALTRVTTARRPGSALYSYGVEKNCVSRGLPRPEL